VFSAAILAKGEKRRKIVTKEIKVESFKKTSLKAKTYIKKSFLGPFFAVSGL
jgi:hypothetical protein